MAAAPGLDRDEKSMLKSYSGYELPPIAGTVTYASYDIEWRCSACGSEDVEIDPDVEPGMRFCDGGPSICDSMSLWRCHACQAQIEGWRMCQTELNRVTRREDWATFGTGT